MTDRDRKVSAAPEVQRSSIRPIVPRHDILAYAPYLIPHAALAAIGIASLAYGYRAYQYALTVWLVVTVLDSFLVAQGPRWRRLIEVDEECAAWTWLLYAIVPLYFIVLLGGLAVANAAQDVLEFMFSAAVVGSAGAIFVIPAAHELMHGKRSHDRWIAAVLMATFSYPHFCIEHTSGHHRNIGTPLDPASAPRGDGFYTFFIRAIPWSIINAWYAEAERLHRLGAGLFSLQNRFLRYAALMVAIYIAVGIYAGARGLLFFGAQGIVAVLILEAINYIQHYGLSRAAAGSNAFEPVRRIHSWDSHHLLSNWCLFNLPQHARHHVGGNAARIEPYSSDSAPRLPLGYFALLWLALFPPLWRSVMNRHVDRWRMERSAQDTQSADFRNGTLAGYVQNGG